MDALPGYHAALYVLIALLVVCAIVSAIFVKDDRKVLPQGDKSADGFEDLEKGQAEEVKEVKSSSQDNDSYASTVVNQQ
jgi:hypothetical protein